MADKTKIEWTDATWNPITGCTLVSDGCRNCYAAQLAATRLRDHPSRAGLARLNADGVAKFTGEVRFNPQWLDQPLSWKRPRMIFVCAHGDLFHESVPDAWIDQIFAVMALAPQHIFQVLTKRPERMRVYLSSRTVTRTVYELACDMTIDRQLPVVLIAPGMTAEQAPEGPRVHLDTWPLPNVWLGTSVEDQATANKRIPELLATPAPVRWISAEPLLGPVDLNYVDFMTDCPPDCEYGAVDPSTNCFECRRCEDTAKTDELGIDWVVAGGESGAHARPMHPDWVRALRDQCKAADVPFLFKQWGAWAPLATSCPVYGPNPRSAAWPDGTIGSGVNRSFSDGPGQQLFTGTKKVTGRLLDGIEHNAFPEVNHG